MAYGKISGFSDEMQVDLVTQLETLKKLNVKYFDPRGIDGKGVITLSDDELTALKEKMDEYGIKASSIGSSIGKITLTEDFEEHFELFKRSVVAAKILDTKFIRIFSFYHDGDADVWTQEERGQVISQLKRMIEYAKENDVILLHENEKHIYGDTAERFLDLMKELYCENFKGVFDPANFVQSGQDTKEAYEMLKDYIVYMHIKDANKDDLVVVPAGVGDGNVEYVLKQLFDSGYDGFLTLEPHLANYECVADTEKHGKDVEKLPIDVQKYIVAYDALCDILDRVI